MADACHAFPVHQDKWPVLVGERCTLPVLSLDDAPAWHAGEDEEQLRWFEFAGPAPFENVVRAIEDWRHSWERDGPVRQWGIWCSGSLAGGVELRDGANRSANVSYVVFPQHRGRGVAKEAVSLAAYWGFDHLAIDAAVAVVDEENLASRAVVEGCGFRLQGVADPLEYSESGAMLRYVLSNQALHNRGCS